MKRALAALLLAALAGCAADTPLGHRETGTLIGAAGGALVGAIAYDRNRTKGALVGAVGPVLSPFFLAHGLVRGAYVSTDALCTVATHVTRGLVFHRYQLLTEATVLVGLYIGVIMIGGAWIGRRLLDRLSEGSFLRLVEALLIVCGLQMLLWPAR